MKCPACQRDNPEDAAFCAGCGSRLALPCPHCGRVNSPDVVYCNGCGTRLSQGATTSNAPTPAPSPVLPASFAGGRYQVKRFLGEGGRKRVYLAHDTRLDRDVAIAVIKTEGLDEASLARVQREAQSMGRLGDHPNVVTVHDIGEDGRQPYIVSQYMSGGDLERMLRRGEGSQIAVETTLRIGGQVCLALEHAHARGVVHRDLKPGNIWLTEDGTAKLGDFGLAVALDRSRVTREGMMIGTVAYMPPEQALGSQADARSDLYSLGCVLYECLTGRPPFVGDSPTAVISQHINIAPVAPSWYTQHCPPDLEALVLRLLAKDPDKRPARAAEVHDALSKIDPAQKSATHSDSNVLDRLARGVFVGREKELDRLRKAFDSSLSGRGGLAMLVGEPGIGKTRTTQEVETYARMRGAVVLWGNGHEGAGAPPYWPWIQVGRAYGQAYALADLVPDMEGKGPELMRIFPELRQLLAAEEPEPLSDPEAAQFQLFDAYTTFVRAMSKRMPLVIVLDDLHWADRPSLLLLRHVGRELSRMRVLIVGTFRDTELARTHPLSEALAALNRESGFERVVLRGLSRDEVAAYIRSVANVEPSRPLLDRIFEETEGNPFFLSEVVNLLTQEGALTKDSISDIAIPDGVREALGRRLDRLSEDANELLQVAAVVGREFTYDMLNLLEDREEEPLLKLIEEALESRVIEELAQPGRYRFTHALMQETLLSELSTTRRVRLHGRVAEALEKRWGDRADERASRLAQHFVEAAMLTPRHAEKAAHYSRLAAQQAEAQYGWDEAARHYEDCLTLLVGAGEGHAEDEPGLLLSLGICARNAGDYRKAWRSLMRAIDLSRQRGDATTMAQATIEALQIIGPPERHQALIEDALQAPGDGDPYLEAQLLAWRLLLWGSSRSQEPAWAEARARVAELAEEHGFEDVRADIILIDSGRATSADQFEESARLRREAYEIHARLGLVRRAAHDLFFESTIILAGGHLDTARKVAEEGFEYARRHHLRFYEENCAGNLAAVLLARCQFVEFDTMCEERAADASFFLPMLNAGRAEAAGDLDRAVALLPDSATAGGFPLFVGFIHSTRARVFLNAGRLDDARSEFQSALQAAEGSVSVRVVDGCAVVPQIVIILDEAVVELADQVFLKAALKGVQRGEYRCEVGRSSLRVLGTIALRLGDLDQAQQLYLDALEWCERERCPIEEGRCLYGLAEVAQQRGDAAEALRHLDKAAALFQKYGARLCLDRAIAKKVELHGIDATTMLTSIDAVASTVSVERPDLRPHAAPDGTVTIMFSDIEGSTALTERLGDKRWMRLLREHNAIVRKQLKAHGGFEVKSEGDGFMLAFQSARKALECAIDIQRALAERNKAVGAQQLSEDSPIAGDTGTVAASLPRVRMGLHTGEAIKEGDDFFGKHVNLAARIAGQAQGGQILVSSLVHELVASAGDIEFEEGRDVELKGLSGSHKIWPVTWS